MSKRLPKPGHYYPQLEKRIDRILDKNPNCDNDKCTDPTGEVRLLPTGGSGNLILCHACYLHEMRFRQERNNEFAAGFARPLWDELKVYSND